MKFSDCVNDLTEMWFEWIKVNAIAVDKNKTDKERREAAVTAEKLLNKRYKLSAEVNDFFGKFDK